MSSAPQRRFTNARPDLKLAKAADAQHVFQAFPIRPAKRMSRFTFIENRLPTLGQRRVKRLPDLTPCAIPEWQPRHVDSIEEKHAAGNEPVVKPVAKAGRHRTAVAKHPERID